MKFSIITPSLNQGRFIRDCIESVSSQAGVELEHIIIDAGSKDETISVLQKFPHLKWTSQPDKGMSDGINQGFLKATRLARPRVRVPLGNLYVVARRK